MMTPSDLAAPDVANPDLIEFDERGFPQPPDRQDGGLDRERHLRVAPKISRDVLRRRRRARLAVFAVGAISAASMFTLVAFHVFAVQSAFKLDKLNTQLNAEQRQYDLLRDQVAAMSSAEAISRAAYHYGMVRSPNPTVLHAPTAASYGSSVSLPVPSPPPYKAFEATGP
jgi:cell division protein FtsL